MWKISRICLVLLLSISLSVLVVDGANTRSACPLYCKCDFYKNLTRANCSSQRLVSTNARDLPRGVQILDLSRNEIAVLDNLVFEGLEHLVNLTISNNSIHTIYLDAFMPLERILFIDLSSNRLESFDERIFESNKKLTSVDLSKNKFMALHDRGLIWSSSIKHLSLRNSHINHIYDNLFRGLPKLETLDLSDNLLITLNLQALRRLEKLRVLNLSGNRWNCDQNLEDAVKWLRSRGVEVQLNECKFWKRPVGQMFERIVMAPIPTTTTEVSEFETGWETDSFEEEDSDSELRCEWLDINDACELYEQCMSNQSLMKRKIVSGGCVCPQDEYIFLLGVVFGSSVVLIVVTLCICVAKCLSTQRQRPMVRRGAISGTSQVSRPRRVTPPQISARQPTRHSFNRSFSTPIHRPPAAHQRDFATFVSSLFERPARQQCYRTINQGTSNMIRRLSRSSLLGRENRAGNISQDTEQLIEPSTSREPMIVPSISEAEQLRIAVNTSLEEANASAPRAETPPPSYVDVVYGRI